MADNWEFVAAAYGLAAIVFGAYWRRLARLEGHLVTPLPRPRRPK